MQKGRMLLVLLVGGLVLGLGLFGARADEDNYYIYRQGSYLQPGRSQMEMGGMWGSREARPFGNRGMEFRLGFSQGLFHRISLETWGGVLNDGNEDNYGASGELVFRALDQEDYPVNLNVGVGYLLDYENESALRLRLTTGRDQGQLNLSSYSLFEFPLETEDRDKTDIIVGAALSCPVLSHSRLGIEAVAEDLEGYWEAEEAEGGAKLLVGPTFWVLANPNLQVKANASYLSTLTANQPTRLVLGTGPSDRTGLQCGISIVYRF